MTKIFTKIKSNLQINILDMLQALQKVIPVLFVVGTDGVDVEDTLVFGILVEGMEGQPMISKDVN